MRLAVLLLSLHLRRPLIHHSHLMSVAGLLRRVWRGSSLLLMWVHVVHWWRLSMWALRILIHLHAGVRRLRCSLCLSCLSCLSGLSSLLTRRFRLHLLLYTWSGRLVHRGRFEVHRRDERLGVFLLRNKRMQFRLLWRPSLQWVDVEQSPNKVNKRDSVVHF